MIKYFKIFEINENEFWDNTSEDLGPYVQLVIPE